MDPGIQQIGRWFSNWVLILLLASTIHTSAARRARLLTDRTDSSVVKVTGIKSGSPPNADLDTSLTFEGSQTNLDVGSSRPGSASQRVLRANRFHGKGSGNDNTVIRELVSNLFGFNAAMKTTGVLPVSRSRERENLMETASDENDPAADSRVDGAPHPPQFMVDLYRTLSENRSLTAVAQAMRGNTVRSFFSAGGSWNLKTKVGRPSTVIPYLSKKKRRGEPTSVFVYNVSSVPLTEEMLEIEIRFENSTAAGSRIGLPNATKIITLSAYERHGNCLEETDCTDNEAEVFHKVGDTVVIESSNGATWSDRRLKKLATKARKPHHILILKVEVVMNGEQRISLFDQSSIDDRMPAAFELLPTKMQSRNDASISMVPNDEFEQLMPILVVYCNDLPDESSPLETAVKGDILGALKKIPMARKVRRSAPVDDPPSAVNGGQPEESEEPLPEPEHAAPTLVVNKRPGQDYKVSQSDREPREQRTRIRRRKNKCSQVTGERLRGGRQRRRKGKCGKKDRRRKKSKKDNLQKEKDGIRSNSALNLKQGVGSCARKSLHVDFGQIGLVDWIISPQFFEAYYCSGHCHYSNSQEASMSNHAIIQSFVKSTGFGENVPEPCCVPDKLLPLSVLFLDEDDSIVLKLFNDMSVETCACR